MPSNDFIWQKPLFYKHKDYQEEQLALCELCTFLERVYEKGLYEKFEAIRYLMDRLWYYSTNLHPNSAVYVRQAINALYRLVAGRVSVVKIRVGCEKHSEDTFDATWSTTKMDWVTSEKVFVNIDVRAYELLNRQNPREWPTF